MYSAAPACNTPPPCPPPCQPECTSRGYVFPCLGIHEDHHPLPRRVRRLPLGQKRCRADGFRLLEVGLFQPARQHHAGNAGGVPCAFTLKYPHSGEMRSDWLPYDVTSPSDRRVEVKAAYLQDEVCKRLLILHASDAAKGSPPSAPSPAKSQQKTDHRAPQRSVFFCIVRRRKATMPTGRCCCRSSHTDRLRRSRHKKWTSPDKRMRYR